MADSRINPDLIFDDFVVDESNEMALSAARLFSCSPASPGALLFIHGPTGTGKTHLLHAIGNTVKSMVPQAHYRPCEVFVNRAISEFRTNSIKDFRNGFKNFDVLLVDDIQLLSGKGYVQGQFLQMLKDLAAYSKRIAVSCDCSPDELQGMQEPLVDRFRGGLVVAIQKPTHRLKATYAAKRVMAYQLNLSEEIILQIASRCKTIREIEGTFQRFTAAKAANIPFNKILDTSLQPPKLSCERIEKIVASRFGMEQTKLHTRSKSRSVVLPRQLVMYLARSLTDMSVVEIGRRFEMNHATVLHAVEKIGEVRKDDSNVDRILIELEQKLAASFVRD